jgi:hypothetical protein
MKRLFRWRRLRWFALGAAVRFVLRRSAGRSVDRATAEIEERLPEPVRTVLDRVPANPARVGGSAVVAAKTARRVASGGRKASQLANDRRRRVADGIERIRSVGDEIGRETDRSARELKARYLRATEGTTAADEALLDLRPHHFDRDRPDQRLADVEAEADDDRELPTVKAAVRTGRWRADRRSSTNLVNRVKRSYRPETKPWDR